MSDSAYQTDPDGFPITTCRRCHGTGTYPSSRWGGRCLNCSGAGLTHPAGTVAQLAAQWRNEHHAMTHITPAVHYAYTETGTRSEWDRVQPGDQIRLHNEPWRTVATVRPTARIVGQTYIGEDPGWLRAVTLETVITFDDGTTVTSRGEQWHRRVDRDKAEARQAELVGQAVKAYERTLKTRVTRAAKVGHPNVSPSTNAAI